MAESPPWMAAASLRMEQVLSQILPAEDCAPRGLHAAMRYAVLGGGKRLRPALALAAWHACSPGSSPEPWQAWGEVSPLERAAAALEFIHVYSLVHDDLPSMDNDDLRRGRPTVHKAFDEATALLVGDALQTLAFETLSNTDLEPAVALRCLQVLSVASGSHGMAGGQAIDLGAVGSQLDQVALEQMHRLKTGALLRASAAIGALIAAAPAEHLKTLDRYASALGLAFQVIDDVLDVTASSEALGKTAGKDQANDKPTFVGLLGVEGSRRYAADLIDQAISACQSLPKGDPLVELAYFVRDRSH